MATRQGGYLGGVAGAASHRAQSRSEEAAWRRRRPARSQVRRTEHYNIIWFTEQCLSNALRMEQYAQDAERDGDNELAEFFRRAQGESRKGGEQGKALLKSRLS